jgi:hypothetical protein
MYRLTYEELKTVHLFIRIRYPILMGNVSYFFFSCLVLLCLIQNQTFSLYVKIESTLGECIIQFIIFDY